MSSKTKIEWTDMTSNPIHLLKGDGKNGGHWCKKISEGCANCYAEEINLGKRFEFASHLKYAGKAPNLILDEAVLQSWVKLKKPHKIFVCSMTDMFGDWVSDDWLDQIFDAMSRAHQHTFQVLTKRPERMAEFIDKSLTCAGRILTNVWLGTSIENQKAVSDRASHLYKLYNRGWTTFYSVEPLLEEVQLNLNPVNWVIVGGESGKGARPCHYEWVLGVVEQCQKSDTPAFVKQLGTNYFQGGASIKVKGKGGDIQELPSPLQVREFPKVLKQQGVDKMNAENYQFVYVKTQFIYKGETGITSTKGGSTGKAKAMDSEDLEPGTGK